MIISLCHNRCSSFPKLQISIDQIYFLKWRFLWHCHCPCHEAQLPTRSLLILNHQHILWVFLKVKLCKEIGHIDKTVPFHCAVNKLSWLINHFRIKAKSLTLTQKNPYDCRCAVCDICSSGPSLMAWAWCRWILRSDLRDQLELWAGPVLQSSVSLASLLTSADPMFTISQSLTPVSSHPLRPEAHYAGPGLAFPRYCALAPYIRTVYYVCNVCNGVGPRAASGRPQ